MFRLITISACLFTLSSCGGQSALDKCTDSKSHLWNKEITGNQYEGNEAYWNAIRDCENG